MSCFGGTPSPRGFAAKRCEFARRDVGANFLDHPLMIDQNFGYPAIERQASAGTRRRISRAPHIYGRCCSRCGSEKSVARRAASIAVHRSAQQARPLRIMGFDRGHPFSLDRLSVEPSVSGSTTLTPILGDLLGGEICGGGKACVRSYCTGYPGPISSIMAALHGRPCDEKD